MTTPFIHLHCHSEFSIEDGLVRIPDLISETKKLEMPAVALTDLSNLFGLVKFYQTAISAGIKPIIGSDVWIENKKNPTKPFRLVLLCQNQTGFHHLIQLISKAYVDGQETGKPVISRDWLAMHNEGLIALSSGLSGDIADALFSGKDTLVEEFLKQYCALFPARFYLELSRTGKPQEETYIHTILKLAKQHNIPVVATNDVRFLKREDFEAHEARFCVHGGWLLADTKRPHLYTEQQYLRTSDEMSELFSDIPEAIENTFNIAKRCNLTLCLGENFLPKFPVPEANLTIEQYLEKLSRQGLEERLAVLFDTTSPAFASIRKPYDERLALEIKVINQMGFAGYFLIVADFIQWSKNNDVPVGPGRGSGAGSLVAYSLKITDLDPLKFGLLFERFLNPERVSMPDFDIDFCMEGRDRVIDYVAEKYGRQSVSQIITFGTMAAKAVIRDVGRVLGYGYGFVDTIAKLIPFEIGITLDKALEQEEVLKERYEKEDEVRVLIDLAKRLEGITRNAGKHAGGVVISPSLLTDFTPLYCESNGDNLMTQLDKDDVEKIGLVKFDFLGLRTLTIIDWAVKNVNRVRKKNGEEPLNIGLIPTEDKKTFQLLKACKTTAVFQLESRGMKELIKRLQPDCFDEIIALVALFRPGPLQSGMVDDFINRKQGRAKVEYLHPQLVSILKNTHGVILYQEQVMQIAQELAGYSLGEADLLRKAMGKKQQEEMAKQRAIFVNGASRHGISEALSTNIFNLMEKFAGYGFNKSHSAAYALLAYQTAWLKAHYPAEFMAAVLSSDMDNTDKVVIFIEECESMELTVLPPNINRSQYQFTVENGQIVYGLGAIKGVGEAAVESIIAERNANGVYHNIFDFCRRVDLHKVNKRVLEALVRSGAVDELGPHRASIFKSLGKAVHAAEQYLRNQSIGQEDLFGGVAESHFNSSDDVFENCSPWLDQDRLQGEKETLGFYFTGHPLELYEEELKHIVTTKISTLRPQQGQSVIVAGLVVAVRTMMSKRGDKMAFVSLNDRSGRMEVAVFSDVYAEYRYLIQTDQLLVVEGEASVDDYSGGYKLSAKKLWNMEQARAIYAKHLLITMNQQADQSHVKQLMQVLKCYQGGTCPVCIAYQRDGAEALLPLGKEWFIQPAEDLLMSLRNTFPGSRVEMVYDHKCFG